MFRCCLKKEYSKISEDKEVEGEIVCHKTPGVVDLLVLGPGECGKSTIIKHMLYLANGGVDPRDKPEIVTTIRSNIVEGVQNLIDGMEQLGIPFESALNKERTKLFKGKPSTMALSNDQVNEMRELIKDRGMTTALKRANEFQFNYAFKYFVRVSRLADLVTSPGAVDNLKLIFSPDYNPTVQDAVHMRKRTEGHIQHSFKFKGVNFRITDVGGQRQERMKWGKLIEGSLMIIFVAAMGDYDLTTTEDPGANRMKEALGLFAAVCANKDLDKKSIFVFLNKADLFKGKIRKTPISKFFKYTGPNDYSSSARFFREEFIRLAPEKHKQQKLHVAVTDATDRTSLEKVFVAVKDTVVQLISNRSLL